MPPRKTTRAFIAYDFALLQGTSFQNELEYAKETQPEGLEIYYPGDDGDAKEQGTIWSSLVKAQIDQADKFIAFVDLPNANVGFEIGYACGRGIPIGVYRFKEAEHPWLQEHPLRGHFRHQANDAKAIHSAFTSDNLLTISSKPAGGDEVTVLCPGNGGPFLGQIDPAWNWKTTPLEEWNLDDDLPLTFGKTGLVVWIITPHGKGEGERDGSENTALSILAGFAECCEELDLRIFAHEEARAIADLEHRSKRFSKNAELKAYLADLAKEWSETIESRKNPVPTVIEVDQKTNPLASAPPSNLPEHPSETFAHTQDLFIGREAELGVAADAVEGVIEKYRTGKIFSGAKGFRLIWAHGFGGMGKSWFLHRIRLQAEAAHSDFRSIIIDWDKPEWLNPLPSVPKVAADLFELLAVRLAQRLGVETVEPYWEAKAQVDSNKDEHKKLSDRFENELQMARTNEAKQVETHLIQLLRDQSLWDEDLGKRTKLIDTIRFDRQRYRELLAAWCQEIGETTPAVICPNRVRADGLRQALRNVMESHPLIVLLDTCEVLDNDHDAWLRELFAPLMRESAPLILLVGSRLRPDLHQPPRSRQGWRAEDLSPKMDINDFGEGLRFTVPEIEGALAKLNRPVEANIGDLAEKLGGVTLGIPLAVRGLLDLHEEGESVFDDLQVPDEGERPLAEQDQVRQVIDQVSERFLLNLQDRPERKDDLRAIIALALLQEYDHEVLKLSWDVEIPSVRLRELAQRYSLLSDGDLHPTVREYLRKYWREFKNRTEEFSEVLAKVTAAEKELADGGVTDDPVDRISDLIRQVNIYSWTGGKELEGEIARVFCLAMVYELETTDLESLLRETVSQNKERGAEKFWTDRDKKGLRGREVIDWLRGHFESSGSWSDEEKASFWLLAGISSAERGMESQLAVSAFKYLEKAREFFGSERVPRVNDVGRAFFDCGRSLGDLSGHNGDKNLIEIKVRCYEHSIQFEHLKAVSLNNVANLYQSHLNEPDKAKESYEKAIELDPKDSYPHNGLGNLYQSHLNEPEKAKESYEKAIELDPKYASPHNGLGSLYLEHLNEPEKAKESYEKAIELDPKYASPHNGLGVLYQGHLNEPEKAKESYEKAIELDPKFAYPHNGLGSLYKDHLNEPEKAKESYEKAIELDPKVAYPHNGLGSLYKDHLNEPEKAKESYEKAIELDPKDSYPHNGLGHQYLDKGMYSEAEIQFRECLEKERKDGCGQRGLTWTSLLNGSEIGEGARWADEAQEVNPSHPAATLVKMAVLAWRSDWGALNEMFEKMVDGIS